MKQILAAAALLVVAAACTSTPTAPPTHYWESSTASGNKYRVDDQSCQQAAAGDASRQPQFELDSESFEAYRTCMMGRGYVLREY